MDLLMGSQVFDNVTVPLLWGTRAVLQDKKARLSVIDLSGPEARVEILGDKPAPGIEFRPISGGIFEILENAAPLYAFDPQQKKLRGVSLRLPECEIGKTMTRIGTNTIQNNMVSGFGVGIWVKSDGGMAIGAPLPPGLAKLRL